MEVKVEKVINNNVVIIFDPQGNEAVAMGRGIGFKRRIGDLISVEKIEKTFFLSKNEISVKLKRLLTELPTEHFIMSEKIIEQIKNVTNWELSDNIYVTLTDHISSAIERQRHNVEIENPMYWDIKHLYPEEYILAKKSLNSISKEYNINLPEYETSYIALHIVNARINTDGNMELVHKVTKIIREITNIVKYHFHIERNLDSLEYYQFVNYLKSLAPRILKDESTGMEYLELISVIGKYYQNVYSCTEKIKKYIEEQYGYYPNGEELLFIAMCLSQIKKKLDEA